MNIKRYFLVLIFTFMSFSVFAAAEVKTDEQKLSYSMGTYFAMGITQQDIILDVPAFIQAIDDVLNKNDPQINTEEMKGIDEKYKETLAV